MASGQLSRPLSPRLHPDPRHARRPRLRLAMGHADEGNRADGLDDRAAVRDRLRKARAQQAPLQADHRPLRAAEAERRTVELVLRGWRGAKRLDAANVKTPRSVREHGIQVWHE